jgi:hypothetical protein
MTDDRNSTEKNGGRAPGGRFAPGNPGRPPGARGRGAALADKLLRGSADAIVRKLIAEALAGSPVALRLAVERLVPVRRDALLTVELPPLRAAADAPAYLSAVAEHVAAGGLTPAEAERLSRLAAEMVRADEVASFDARLKALEASHGQA